VCVLGLKRTVIAGWLLVALGVLPIAASSLGSVAGTVSLSIVSVIPLITGILYLVSARLCRRSASVHRRTQEAFFPIHSVIPQLTDVGASNSVVQ